MKIPNRLLVPLALALPVLAQPVEPERSAIGEAVSSQQRRADLRSALKAQSQTQAAETLEGRYRLSPQERAELREQLRQQQSVSRPRS